MAIIKIKNSSVAHKRALPTVLANGELALNYNALDTGLFFKDTNQDLVKVGPTYQGDSPPNNGGLGIAGGQTGYTRGETWLDSASGRLFIYYVGASSSAWIQVA